LFGDILGEVRSGRIRSGVIQGIFEAVKRGCGGEKGYGYNWLVWKCLIPGCRDRMTWVGMVHAGGEAEGGETGGESKG
jgi:hypothetical protein